jgi:hypothetical protein
MNGSSPWTQVSGQLPDYQMRIEIWALLGCLLLFGVLIELIRRKKLKERYAFLWFLTSGALMILTLKRVWLEDFAQFLGVYYPPSALFHLLVFSMILILIHFSTVISGLLNDKQVLTQHLGILESRVRELEKNRSGTSPDEGISNSED